MSVPSLAVQSNGVGVVTGDNFDTYVQGGALLASLRAFTGLSNMTVWMLGFLSPGDGGQGMFYWNATSTATDDGGVTTIAPSGQTNGRWLRQANSGVMGISSATNVPLTTGTPADITSVTLLPGNWIVNGFVNFVPAGTTVITQLGAVITGTPNQTVLSLSGQLLTLPFSTGQPSLLSAGTGLVSLLIPTTLYLVATASFTVSTMAAGGSMVAMSVRP